MMGCRDMEVNIATTQEVMQEQAEEIQRLKAAVSLLNSMVLSGEQHSDRSRAVVKKALGEKE